MTTTLTHGGIAALRALERLARAAVATGVEAALHPHAGFWNATTEGARTRACARGAAETSIVPPMTPPDPTPTRSALCKLISAGVRFPGGKRVGLGASVAALAFGRRAVARPDVVHDAAGC